MTKRVLYTIVVAMSISMIGLLVIQSIWVRNIFTLNEKNFRSNVKDAATAFILQLEKDEINEQFKQHDRRYKIASLIDSLNQSLQSMQIQNPDVFFEKNVQGILNVINSDDDGLLIMSEVGDSLDEAPEQKINSRSVREKNHRSAQNLKRLYRQLRNERDQYLNKSQLIDEWLQEVVGLRSDLPFVSRVNPYAIDSLLRKQMMRFNIDTPYEWGVFSENQNKLIIQKTGKYKQDLLESNLVYRFFPADRGGNTHYLVFYMPHMRYFLFSRVSVLLLLSLLLIIGSASVYAYTLSKVMQNRKLTEIKADFINNMTHEIKTPIATIALVCEALEDPLMNRKPESLRNYVHLIRQENERLQSLSQHIIEISKLERGQMLLQKKEVNLHEAITDAISNMEFQVHHKNGQIITHLEASRPCIQGDYIHLVNVVSNLIDNANKYCQQIPFIQIISRNVDKGIEIQVIDNGMGIPRSYSKKIFDTLYRIPTGNIHNVKGFGLGLSYAKSVVEKHEGTIRFESDPKKGTIFYLFFHQPYTKTASEALV